MKLRDAAECRFDCVALGEVMLRLDPGDGRVRTARQFRASEGGGEYNVARGLRRTFQLSTALVSSFVENEIGELLYDLLLQSGVDISAVKWQPFDGVGRAARNGLNFTERGFGVRGAVGTSDRGHSAASQLKPGDIDWDDLFGGSGSRWFHTGGIFAALSETTAELAIEALTAARSHGVITSYDLNYRPSLWKSHGGPAAAQTLNKRIAPLVDVMLGNEEDFTACLGLTIPTDLNHLDPKAYERMIETAVAAYPNFQAVATTLRTAQSASINDWGALLYTDSTFYHAMHRPGLAIYDRVGGGDSFAAGLIYGFLAEKSPQACVEYGAAHGALAMTTPGDTAMASLAEVEKLVRGGSARVER